jgi:large subunit ribosomal protein L9
MQVILLEKVANVGNLGDVVKVKAGYARNYLIPHGMARRATPENLKLIEARRAELEKAAAEKLAAAQALGEKLEGTSIRILQRAGVDGRLFGSVGNVDIVEALAALGVAIEKAQVRMPSGPLKHVGDHPVTIVLHTDVVAHVNVTVQGETVAQG